jgi:MFS family permease
MPPPPPWIAHLRDATQVISFAGFAFLLFGLIGGALSSRLKEIRRPLVITGLVLLGVCLVAAVAAGVAAYQFALERRGG